MRRNRLQFWRDPAVPRKHCAVCRSWVIMGSCGGHPDLAAVTSQIDESDLIRSQIPRGVRFGHPGGPKRPTNRRNADRRKPGRNQKLGNPIPDHRTNGPKFGQTVRNIARSQARPSEKLPEIRPDRPKHGPKLCQTVRKWPRISLQNNFRAENGRSRQNGNQI